MTTNKNIEKYLWITTVVFVTYLFLGSFVVSRNFYELVYLIILYSFMCAVKIIDRKK
ncbi:MAG: hypothetical protein IJY25_02935 [Bacilli bacterium]|nr:hypothetical protein [Bacilli bacterium]